MREEQAMSDIEPYTSADPYAESGEDRLQTYLDEEYGDCTCTDTGDICPRCAEESSIRSMGEP